MTALNLAEVKCLYRAAIDSQVSDAEGEEWWQAVAAEVQAVLAAPTAARAAQVIAWWHHDWSAVSDSAMKAAGRIRRAASRLSAKQSS